LISENLSNKSYNRERTKTIMLTHIHGYYIYLPRIVWDHASSTLLQLKSQRGRGAVLRVAWHTDMVSRFESADMFAITFTKTKTQSGCHAMVTSGIYVVMFDVIYTVVLMVLLR
jgi:hypothetical protein